MLTIFLSCIVGVGILSLIFSLIFFGDVANDNSQEFELKIDVSVSEMLTSEQKVKEKLEELEITDPNTPIEIIASKLGIRTQNIPSMGHRAYMTNASGEIVAYLRVESSKAQKRFDLAHECGHIINGDPLPATKSDTTGKSHSEQLADYTGVALLMPLEIVAKRIDDSHYSDISHKERVDFIKSLAKDFGVDETTALRRVYEIYTLNRGIID